MIYRIKTMPFKLCSKCPSRAPVYIFNPLDKSFRRCFITLPNHHFNTIKTNSSLNSLKAHGKFFCTTKQDKPKIDDHQQKDSRSDSNQSSHLAPSHNSEIEASTAGNQPSETNVRPNEEQPRTSNWKRKLFMYLIISPFAVYTFYKFHLSGYSPSKTEWLITNDIKKVFVGHEANNAELRSEFTLSLNPETSKEIAQYFISLDIDKDNGVRKSDILDLIEQLGFNKESETVKKFIDNSPGSRKKDKVFSGCTMKECGELIESLIIDEEIKTLPAQDTSKDFFKFDFNSFQWISTRIKNLQKKAKEQVEKNLTETENRVQQKLKELNKTFNNNQLSLTNMPFDLFKRGNETTEPEDATLSEMKKLELERMEKLKESLEILQKNRGFSDAEQTRYDDLISKIDHLKSEIFNLDMQEFIKQ